MFTWDQVQDGAGHRKTSYYTTRSPAEKGKLTDKFKLAKQGSMPKTNSSYHAALTSQKFTLYFSFI